MENNNYPNNGFPNQNFPNNNYSNNNYTGNNYPGNNYPNMNSYPNSQVPNAGFGENQYQNNNYFNNQFNNVNINSREMKLSLQNPEFIAFIGDTAPVYASKFQKLAAKNKNTGWNWSAFFCLGYWAVYRKMYGKAFLIYFLQVLSLLIPALILIASDERIVLSLFLILPIAVRIWFARHADNFYRKRVEKELDIAQAINPQIRLAHLEKRGGTNIAGVIVLILLPVFSSVARMR